MKIYTKTGDTGETSLFGGGRVPKDASRIEAYGTVDELNSVIGIIMSQTAQKELQQILSSIQNDLFVVGADLATPHSAQNTAVQRISNEQYDPLERIIDRIELHLTPLKTFILPGGSTSAAQLHFARTVCRRAERCVVKLSHAENIGNEIIIYLNRLSDLLFVLARYANHLDQHHEIPWQSEHRIEKNKTKDV